MPIPLASLSFLSSAQRITSWASEILAVRNLAQLPRIYRPWDVPRWLSEIQELACEFTRRISTSDDLFPFLLCSRGATSCASGWKRRRKRKKRRTGGSDITRTIAHFSRGLWCISPCSRLRLVTMTALQERKKKYIYIYIYILYIYAKIIILPSSVVNMCTYSV